MIASIVLTILLLVAVGFAVKHVYKNIKSGHQDCCGSSCESCCRCHKA